MRRLPTLLLVVVLASLAAGCDDDAADPAVLVTTTSGVAVLDSSSGKLGPAAPAAVASPAGDVLVRGDLIGTRTSLRAVDVGGGPDRWEATVEGSFEPRVVGADGRSVAMVRPGGGGATTTELAVVRAGGDVETYEVDGNIEPEAFSVDGDTLFVVSYLPPEAPTSYQVRRLDLVTGELGDVRTPDAHLQEQMQGTARTHAWAPDGSRLYTLYTQPVGGETVAFVHVLDLEGEWAHCLLLPDGFSPASGGLALDHEGDDLYAVDLAAGLAVHVDTEALAVESSASLPADPAAATTPVTVAGDDLLVGAGDDVLVVDRSTLEVDRSLAVPGVVQSVQASTRAGEAFVALPHAVLLVDLADGEELRRVSGQIVSLGGRSVPLYAGYQCAC